ncbi:MAG: sugar phosphate isomerase/epimerase [Verrucomicrobia bacterium]|nr:sugar phosphate isomerase/epimerase [Verrucomicrobiota bacterium]
MEPGIFTKTFARSTTAEVFDAVAQHGLRFVQFNFASAGLPSLPDQIDPGLVERIRGEMEARQISMAAISGTFNLIHPDLDRRRDGLRRLRTLATVCGRFGTPVIALCTGTRDPENMWRRHADNDSAGAWRELTGSMQEALDVAETFHVTLGIEPEVSNVIDSARKARRLLDQMQSPRLKVIMDGANLFHAGELPRMREMLEEAFELLGPDIVLAHAKDLSHDGDAGHEVAGRGRLDYDWYLGGLARVGYAGPLLLHGLAEAQVDEAVGFLRGKLAALSGRDVAAANRGNR